MAFVGEAFTSAAVGLLLTQFGTPAFKKIASSRRVKKEVIRLEKTLNTIKGVLPHAEQLQATNDSVRSWLKDIKDLAYEAEDIIDDYLIEVRRRQLGKQDNLFKRVCHSPSSANTKFISPFKIVGRIKDVREKLRDILDNQAVVSLLKTGVVVQDQENSGFVSGREREQTHSYIPETEVFGRDVDRDAIVKLLLDSSEHDELSIIPILGMGGIGKTTLAKLVFNDERVIDKFKKPRMWWVCVSDSDTNFSVRKLTGQIIEAASKSPCPNLEMEQLMTRLHEHLEGDKFLLVLDDVWNVDTTKWDDFKKLLPTRANGSKIIVTTRNVRVGSIMNSISPYELSELHDEHCWELFKRRACIKQEEQFDPELLKIGRDIVKKCKGVPLAAETLGGLCFGAKKQTWERVRDNDLWNFPEETNGILRALRISYSYLPLDLKQCFAFCSVFPKNYEIKKDMLVASWITHGFIRSPTDMQSLEAVGNEFVEILMHASLIKLDGSFEGFKMHDLVHDLAQVVAGGECFNICNSKDEKIPKGVRHLFWGSQVSSSTFEAHCTIPEPSKLRTLIIESLPDSIGKLKHLRYLTIRGRKLKELPESITDLQNLEILDISDLSLQKLPKCIGKLVNLKHLNLNTFCISTYFPSGLEKLTALQTLSIFIVSEEKMGCKLNELYGLNNIRGSLTISGLENVKRVEDTEKTRLTSKKNLEKLTLKWGSDGKNVKSQTIGLGVLANLEPHSNLKYFSMEGYVGTSFPPWMMEPSLSLNNVVKIELRSYRNCQQLPPLGLLPALECLELYHMKVACYFDHKLKESQKDLFPSLETLRIEDALNLESWVSMECQQQQGLSLSVSFPRLIDLKILGCPKLKNMPLLPSVETLKLRDVSDELLQSLLNPNPFLVTLNSSQSLGNVVKVELQSCHKCQQLPPLGLLPALVHLRLYEMEGARYFDHNLKESQKDLFPSLETLCIEYSLNLESWVSMESQQQQGRSLSVSFPRLIKLKINDCPKLRNMPLLPSVEDLELRYVSDELLQSLLNPNPFLVTVNSSHSLGNVVSIELQNIQGCQQLPPFSSLPSLRTLKVRSMPDLRYFEGKLEESQKNRFPSLTFLYVESSKNLESWIPMEKLEDGGFLLSVSFPCLPDLMIIDCPRLKNMPLLPAIRKLYLAGISSELVHSVLNPNYSLVTLKRLTISTCAELEYLPENRLQGLVSLTDLLISNCTSLTSLSLTGNGMPHLTSLGLNNLPKLVCLPQELQTLIALEFLHIIDCESLNSRPNWSGQQLPSLRGLLLKYYSEDTLPEWMANFTSLQVLILVYCKNLQVLPEWVLRADTTVKNIEIHKCPHLKKRYSKPTGEDWQKTAHIQISGFGGGPPLNF